MKSTPTIAAHLPAHLIVASLVALGRWGAPRWGVGRSVQIANQLAGRLLKRSLSPGALESTLELGRVSALRAGRLVPGANCLHRAFALRIWLATQGVDARIVIGFRKREGFEGHAWLEVSVGEANPLTLFCSEADGYRAVANEELILAKLRFS